MRYRTLLIGVVLPAALSQALLGAMLERRDERHHRRVARAEHVRFSYDARGPRPPHRPEPIRMRPTRIGRCDVRETHVLTAPATAADRIAVEGGRGELEMEAVAGLDHVRVEATLCAGSPDELQLLDVTLKPDGDLLRLATIEPALAAPMGPSDRYGRVDLTVQVPMGMQATIGDPAMRHPGPPGARRPRRP